MMTLVVKNCEKFDMFIGSDNRQPRRATCEICWLSIMEIKLLLIYVKQEL